AMEMNTVSIKSIIDFLQKKKYNFSFNGNEKEVINGFSTLFNYKEGSITFVSTLYKFKDYIDLFNEKNIQLIITNPSENVFDCFNNCIQIEKPTNAFFDIL